MRVSGSLKWSVTLSSLVALAGCQSPPATPEAEAEPAEPTVNETSEVVEEAAEVTEPSAAAASYADGSYQATGDYQSPNGAETIEVSVTVSGGVIDSIEVVPQATNSTSTRYQGMFAGGIANEVVGKSLDEADVSRVAGSSLTSGGFAEALEAIRQDAKAS